MLPVPSSQVLRQQRAELPPTARRPTPPLTNVAEEGLWAADRVRHVMAGSTIADELWDTGVRTVRWGGVAVRKVRR